MRDLRLRANISQESLGAVVGISQSQLGKIERHQHKMRPDLVQRIAAALRVQPWEVVAVDDPTERHRALLELFDAMPPDAQNTYLRIGKTLIPPAEPAVQRRLARRKRA